MEIRGSLRNGLAFRGDRRPWLQEPVGLQENQRVKIYRSEQVVRGYSSSTNLARRSM